MAKIKWQNKADIEAKKAEQKSRKAEREQLKGKEFKFLSTKDKDKILEFLAKEHGLL
jgi:hypothetical protein